MRTLYFDCFAGASGNMILGGIIGLGVDPDDLTRELKSLSPVGFDIQFNHVDRSGIAAIHASVSVPDEKKHRHLSDIEKIIDASQVTARVKERSKAIFRRLAEAEARVHGIDTGRVHFHEVGAMDAIIDIVGACVGFDLLGVEQFVCSKIHVGSGFVDMAHGKFPVPPPAVIELVGGIPYYSTEVNGELATPTGVAIVTTLAGGYTASPELKVERIGYGAGTREYERFPNVIRLVLGESTAVATGSGTDRLIQLETNIDDLSPQILGYVMERAFELGALDCWFAPIQMKKNRPAVMLSVLCEREKRKELTDLIYTETSTLGIRVREVERVCLEREIVSVSTEFGPVDVKIGRLDGKVVNAMPEYEQVRRIALENRVAFRAVRDAALARVGVNDRHSALAASNLTNE
ncbi:MAG TPA: nickel pincer cofactor biosynthesis protein LarC [Pyrinomonadaceae bacterium]